MFISKANKYRKLTDGTYESYPYYRLTQSFRDESGNKRSRSVLCLGTLDGFSGEERDELADMLTVMIEKGESVTHGNEELRKAAMNFYMKYRDSKYARENDPRLKAEYEKAEAERRKGLVAVRINSLTQRKARAVGCESLCNSTLRMLNIRGYLASRGWDDGDIDMAMMQIVARCIYPFSELKTTRCLLENSALHEMFHIPAKRITKDALYRSARRLWDEHHGLEDYLHRRVCNLFDIEERILLFDITNVYFEGRYDASHICKYGRSKEKRDDCKIVVLAAVVNTDGLLVRTVIYEGNRADSTTLEEVVGSMSDGADTGKRKIVVMDAGFYSASNIRWLTDNGYDYITVLPAGDSRFTPASDRIVHHEDRLHHEIRLQVGSVAIDGESHKALLVDSDAKALKERSMYERACQRYEEGLEAIKASIGRKHGTKKRDAVNRRLGRLNGKYGAISKSYTITLGYSGEGAGERVSSMEWHRNDEKSDSVRKFHGKYVLLTSLDENDEVDIWRFYNVIRTVEETFRTLKTDLDIRPVFHKTDLGVKAHLNLAVLAYWVVSVTKHRLKLKGYDNVRWDEIMRIASTQVAVTASMETDKGDIINIRQCTVPEDKLAEIYDLLGIHHPPIKKTKSVVHPKPPFKKSPKENQGVT